MVGSKCNLKTHVRNLGYPFPLLIGGPKTTFLGRLRNSTASLTAYVGSKCNLKTHVRNLGYPLPLQIGGPKITFFGRLCDSTAILTAYIFGTKHDTDNPASALQTTRGLLHRPNALKPHRTFYAPSLFGFVAVHRTPSMRH